MIQASSRVSLKYFLIYCGTEGTGITVSAIITAFGGEHNKSLDSLLGAVDRMAARVVSGIIPVWDYSSFLFLSLRFAPFDH
ncbi:hypothetical protein HOY82DRAFT_553742 [Tuber indicum]|nr:hypothetical protein HOY82DRAFT_553742 [Tuber indicum]